MDDTRLLPVEEIVHYGEFSDRVEILRELNQWVRNIGRNELYKTPFDSSGIEAFSKLVDKGDK
ncbi:MAG: hypothetical protein GY859_07525 [Desulfobacterales bacterium]|nr:hypothetical protein [Desulfobacterales bacterium]